MFTSFIIREKNLEYDDGIPIVSLSYRANIEKYLKKILYDNEFRQILLQKNKLYLKKFCDYIW